MQESPISKSLSGTLSVASLSVRRLRALAGSVGTNSDSPIVFMTADPSCGQRLRELRAASSRPLVLRLLIGVDDFISFLTHNIVPLQFFLLYHRIK